MTPALTTAPEAWPTPPQQILDCETCVDLLRRLTATAADDADDRRDEAYPWQVAYLDAVLAGHVAEQHPRLVPARHTDCDFCTAFAVATGGGTDGRHLARDLYLPERLR